MAEEEPEEITHGSLFAGIGGFDEGFRRAKDRRGHTHGSGGHEVVA